MMKIKRKGKIHPSPPPATLHTAASSVSLSVLNLLPAAILALIASLTLQDREVLAYMITRSLKTTTTSSINSSSPVHESKKLYRNDKQMRTGSVGSGGGSGGVGSYYHKSPAFDCECFDCYTSFWFRWDSSPNRELIHKAIEAFEEHLASREVQTRRSSNRRAKKKDKLPFQNLEKDIQVPNPALESEASSPEIQDIDVNSTPAEEVAAAAEEVTAVVRTATGGHKGFARKVLPDVLGVFNSRLWNLWGPNV
ncbi:unnamed protein product [Rhodiola kirilowii]